MNLDMTMFHQAFFEEAIDMLADLEELLLRLEETPEDPELLNSIFRCAHSIKGGSATFGFAEIAQFTHGLETLLDLLRNGHIHVSRPLTQLLLESQDQLKALLAVARGEAQHAPDSAPLEARISAAIEASRSGEGSSELPQDALPPQIPVTSAKPAATGFIWHLRLTPGPDVLKQGIDPSLLLLRLAAACTSFQLQCDSSRLPSLTDMDAETCYLAWDAQFQTEWSRDQILDIFEFIADESEIVLNEQAVPDMAAASETAESCVGLQESASLPAARESASPISQEPATLPASAVVNSRPTTQETAGSKLEQHTLRVSTDKVDKLINLVGELIINQAMLNAVVHDFSMTKLPRLLAAVADTERASRELQERVMAIRMLPIKHAFGRFPRLVRDLAAACGKRIELKMSGEETELDKSVIEAIADPLTHLVRNSIDHGLEPPEARLEAGKPEVGIVALHAYHEGGSIVVEISDDGRGLDRDRIYRKAVERGLLSEHDPVPPDDAIYNFIFHPGFSTAAQVTDLSGRGVGMDIVKQGIQALGGSISLTTTPGKGTCFRIRLPLTLAILEGLSLSVGEETYILPLTSIVESIRPGSGDVHFVAGMAEVAVVRGEALPILRLYDVFHAKSHVTDPTLGLLVIVENEGRKVALLVDELIGQSQVVIKSLESNYGKVDGIAGATILGDGQVALIVDVPGLVRNFLHRADSLSMVA